jgi:hypothetical protein
MSWRSIQGRAGEHTSGLKRSSGHSASLQCHCQFYKT